MVKKFWSGFTATKPFQAMVIKKMPEKYDRREMLKKIGTGFLSFALVPLGLVGCGGGEEETTETIAPSGEKDKPSPQTSTDSEESDGTENGSQEEHTVPHPDNVELADAEAEGTALGGGVRTQSRKSPKDGPSVQHQHEPNGDKRCGTCAMFVPDENGDGYGACTMVEGTIHPCDFCILYTEYTGEGNVPCKA